MNRRSFFSKAALIGAAVSLSPAIFIPKFEPVRWKPRRFYHVLAINPEWINAPYEIGFIGLNGCLQSFVPVPEHRRSLWSAYMEPDGKTWKITEPTRYDKDLK